jgi:DnaJ-domain-containing protein 1
MARIYIQKSIFELQEMFEVSKTNHGELKKIAAELKHRQVPKATALAKKVHEAIAALAENAEQTKLTKQTEAVPEQRQIVNCKCGQRLRLPAEVDNRDYTCPKCKTIFSASFNNGILTVVFEKEQKPPPDDSAPLSLEDAYRLFDADKGTAWESIEQMRRRLLQQYHPDKVAALGPKLRVVAEAEGKRINVAFTMVRKSRGL